MTTRRSALRLLFSGAGVALLAACAPAPSAPPAATQAPPANRPPRHPRPPRPACRRCPQRRPPRPSLPRRLPGSQRRAARCAWAWWATSSTVDGQTRRPTVRHDLERLRSPHQLRRQAAAAADAGRELGSGPTAADQAQPAQGRAVPHRARVHQRRRQVQPAARARCQAADPDAAQPEQLVHAPSRRPTSTPSS